ncbi:MAG: CehA/McbA family metallohydrolase [Deltaproteobacteria bacterium]
MYSLPGLLCVVGAAAADERVLTAKLHHLRSGAVREWADFPEQAEAAELRLTFPAKANAAEQTLRLRHRDVKQTWKVRVNDREVGRLPPDENDMVTYWAVPPNTLKDGPNVLVISSQDKAGDDISIGDVRLDDRPRAALLGEARVEVTVTEAPDGRPLPCRLTVIDSEGALMTTDTSSREGLAVRPGVLYTADGKAEFGLPAGKYTLYAGRGFEYGVASAGVVLQPGETAVRKLTLRREVPTEGYVACDTHCHTLTLSGHGDATLAERMVTIAGEGIELPIATDHNVHADYEKAALAAGVRGHFTPIIGNEVTTPRIGHFNIFPIAAGAKVVNHAAPGWPELFREMHECPNVSVIVLNHPRDVHGGYRPFGPEHHLSLVGENLDGWKLEANALEAVNSGALQSDVMLVYRDWFGLLNRGFRITPVGASDSHDVSRFFVGQGRTYIRCNDNNPAAIDVAEACRNLDAGRALVSLGLLCEMSVNGRHGAGDLVAPSGEIEVAVRVLGPSWSQATHVGLYANGVKIREAEIREAPRGSRESGLKWKGTWRLPKFKHDVHLAGIATGPGVKELFWPIPRPYQPSSPIWHPYVVGSTGAVWIDADGSGQFTPAFEYAARFVEESGTDFARLLSRLAEYDEAVAAQAARIVHVRKLKTPAELLDAATRTDVTSIRNGFQAYVEAWKESETARLAK